MAKDLVNGPSHDSSSEIIQAGGESSLALPDVSFLTNSRFVQNGQDLVLETKDGDTLIIEGYFSAFPPPLLTAPGGAALSPDMIKAFTTYDGPTQYAQSATMNDASPVGLVREIDGSATVTHPDGSTQPLTLGTAIFQGDIIETAADSGVEVLFIDESTFAVSANARLAIDEYVFNPTTEGGSSNFSLLRGVFIYTSGLIGRADPDDIEIDTPVGSIGIRGTTIAGSINPDGQSYITVTEGAIVVSNSSGELTLAEQFETATLTGYDTPIESTDQPSQESLYELYGSLQTISQSFLSAFGSGSTLTDQNTAEHSWIEYPSQSFYAFDSEADTFDGSTTLLPTTPTSLSNEALTTGTAGTTNLTSSSTTGNVAGTSDSTTLISSTESDSAVPPLLPLELEIIINEVREGAAAGDTVAMIKTTVEYPSVDFNLLNIPEDSSGNPLFSITQTAPNQIAVSLTSAGVVEIDAGERFSFDIMASLPDGRAITRSTDININSPLPQPLMLNGISGSDGFTIAGSGGEQLGYDVAAWGDINGDGFDDILVANNLSSGGVVYQISGGTTISQTTIPGSPGLNPSISGIGDFDGDGQIDFIIGAPQSNSSITGGGSAVISSSSSPIFNGQDENDALGQSVAGIGDINGDGLMDILVSAPGANNGAGTGYVIFGSTSLTTIDLNDANNNGIADFQDSGFGFAINGLTAGQNLGMTVSAAGDFNNDGYSDFMLAEPGQGRVHLAFGAPNQTDITLGTDTLTIENIAVDGNGHLPIFHMGDMNGDGISDIAIGATGKNTDSDSALEGVMYVIYGNAAAAGGQVIDVNNLSSSQGFTIAVSDPDKVIAGGGYAGDFNGDGFDDGVVVFRKGGTLDIHVVYGGSGSPGTLTDADLLNPANGFHMQYDLSFLSDPLNDPFKLDISTAGDMNGDGFADLAIGTPNANGGDGGITIVYGRNETATGADGQQAHIAGQTTALDDVTANGNNQHLVGNSGNNILDTNGFSNITMKGGAGDDVFLLSGTAKHIDGGTGFDTVQLLGANRSLDYSNVGSEALSGIEKFEMVDNGQSIKLGLDDVFRLLQESSNGQLRIDDTSGGITSLVIDDNSGANGALSANASALGFDASGTANVDGVTYDVYTFNSYQLLIDQNIDNVAVA